MVASLRENCCAGVVAREQSLQPFSEMKPRVCPFTAPRPPFFTPCFILLIPLTLRASPPRHPLPLHRLPSLPVPFLPRQPPRNRPIRLAKKFRKVVSKNAKYLDDKMRLRRTRSFSRPTSRLYFIPRNQRCNPLKKKLTSGGEDGIIFKLYLRFEYGEIVKFSLFIFFVSRYRLQSDYQ